MPDANLQGSTFDPQNNTVLRQQHPVQESLNQHNRWRLNVKYIWDLENIYELFVPENIFLFKPNVIMKLLRNQALPVVRTEV